MSWRRACCGLGGGCTWFGAKGGQCTKKELKAAGRRTQRQRDMDHAREARWKEDRPAIARRHRMKAAAAKDEWGVPETTKAKGGASPSLTGASYAW